MILLQNLGVCIFGSISLIKEQFLPFRRAENILSEKAKM